MIIITDEKIWEKILNTKPIDPDFLKRCQDYAKLFSDKFINIYLDDLRPAPKGFVLVKTVKECQILMMNNKGKINILSLDHDLGKGKTGYDLVKWLVFYNGKEGYGENLFPNKIYLHTANPVGRENMYRLLEHYKPDYVKIYNSPIPNNM